MAKANKEEQRKAPILRFKGFTDDWEQRKLDSIAKVYDGIHETPNYTTHGIPFVSVENIRTLTTKKYVSKNFYEEKFKIKPQCNDILMTRIGDIGTSNVVSKLPLAYYVSLALIRLNTDQDAYFFKYFFDSKYVQKELWSRTLHIAFPKKINKNEIGKINIYTTHSEEENKIAQLFNKLNNMITLYERKLKLIKLIYKELENKVYNNDLIKQTSFIKVKLREILQEKNIKSTYENQYPILSSTNSGIELRNGRTNSSSNIGYKILSKNELVLSPQNLWLGNININFNFENGLVSPSYRIFKLSKNINPIFLNSLLHHPKMMYLYKVVSVQGASVVRRNLDIEAFEKLSLQLPAVKIQNKIGSLLNKVQKLTDNLENKRKQLIKIKNMLLNTMFI